MAKTIYRWDADGFLTTTDVVADDYVLKSNETTTGPDKIEKSTVKWDGSGWRQLTDEEDAAYVKAHQTLMPMPNQQQGPTNDQKLLMNQQADIVQLQKTVMSQQSNMANMQKLIMTQQAQLTELKKGSN